MREPFDRLVLHVSAFGAHVDKAPLTHAHFHVDRQAVRQMVDLLLDFRSLAGGRFPPVPQSRDLDGKEAGLAPVWVARKDMQRRPFYKVFQEVRQTWSTRYLSPALVEHLEPVESDTPKMNIGLNALSFHAIQRPVERHMHTTGLTLGELYTALAALTPEQNIPDLLQEMSSTCPKETLSLLVGDPFVFSPEGHEPILAEGDVALTLPPETVAALLSHADGDVRQRVISHLSSVRIEDAGPTRGRSR